MQPYYVARLGAETRPGLLRYSENKHITRELRQYREFIWIDLAHALMLGEARLISSDTRRKLLSAILDLLADDADPETLYPDAREGSLLLQIERRLGQTAGTDVAGQLHTARSRLDQGPTARRMFKRRRCLDVMSALAQVVEVAEALAEKHSRAVMPGYTCLQHAHPTTFGHCVSAFADRLLEQSDRLRDCYARVDLSPLGGVGLSGTAWPIDRDRTAALLGFPATVRHARRCRDAYYAAEIVAVLSTVMSVLYDMCTDLCLWSGSEFGFVEIDAGLCSTSSVFPNKRNPTALDALRARAGSATGWLSTTLSVFRGTGTGDVVMQEVELIDQAFGDTEASLLLVADILSTLAVDTERLRSAAKQSWAAAGSVADLLFREHAVPYRSGYTIMATLVRRSLEEGRGPQEVNAGMVAGIADGLGIRLDIDDEAVRGALDPSAFVASAESEGGCGPRAMGALTAHLRDDRAALEAFVAARREHIDHAWRTTVETARKTINIA